MKKIHRFITEYRLIGQQIEVTNPEIVHHIKDVLKLRAGEHCVVTNEDNIECSCQILETDKKKIILEIISKEINHLEPKKKVHLYLGILKKENFEVVVQKAGEMGVAEITPLITEHTVKTNLNYDRLEKIAREASELSGRSQVTKINEIVDFETAIVQDINKDKIFFDVTGTPFEKQKLGNDISIYIGPEGGFTDKEIVKAKENNCHITTLGPLTLRGETAAIIASYIAINL